MDTSLELITLLLRIISTMIEAGAEVPQLGRRLLPLLINDRITPERQSMIIKKIFEEVYANQLDEAVGLIQ